MPTNNANANANANSNANANFNANANSNMKNGSKNGSKNVTFFTTGSLCRWSYMDTAIVASLALLLIVILVTVAACSGNKERPATQTNIYMPGSAVDTGLAESSSSSSSSGASLPYGRVNMKKRGVGSPYDSVPGGNEYEDVSDMLSNA